MTHAWLSAVVGDQTQPFDGWDLLPFLLAGENRQLSKEVLEDKPGIHGCVDFDGTVLTGVNVIHFGIELGCGSPF